MVQPDPNPFDCDEAASTMHFIVATSPDQLESNVRLQSHDMAAICCPVVRQLHNCTAVVPESGTSLPNAEPSNSYLQTASFNPQATRLLACERPPCGVARVC